MAHFSLRLALAALGLSVGLARAAPPPDGPPSADAPSAPTSQPPAVTPLPPPMVEGDYEMGDPKAKVTVVEYASDTCPHCARFASEVFPAFKKAYVDTGKVLYVFREFPTDPVPLASAGFILARCSGREKYFDVVNALFQAQSTSATGLDFLMAGAKPAGLSEDQVKACLNEKPLVEAFNARLQKALDVAKINSTPTFVVNGRKLESGEKSLKDLSDAIDPLLGPQTRAGRRRHPA